MRIRKTAQERKIEIIEATLQLVNDHGTARVSIETIARKIGLTQPGVLRHFSTKQDIWKAVAGYIIDIMSDGWGNALSGKVTPESRLQAIVKAQLSLIQSIPAIPEIILSRELHSGDQILRNTFSKQMARFHVIIVEELSQISTHRKGLNEEDAAFLIIGMIQGQALGWIIGGMSYNLVAEGERLLKLLLRGFNEKQT
jgi:AcrR family transcriptional regulator